jgi:hypothetical protein
MSKYKKAKNFYITELWPLKWVWNAVIKWITEGEFREITGQVYKNKK